MIDMKKLSKAIILTQENKIKDAENTYLELLANEPNNPMLLSFVGLFYSNIKDFEKAEKYLIKSYNLSKTLATVSALGFMEYERKNFEKSVKYLEESLKYGENPDVYNKLILSLFNIKNYSKAIEYSTKMHQLYPDNSNAVAHMVKALTQIGKLFEAEKLAVGFLREHPESSSLWFHLGFLKELIYSDDRQACQCYNIALENGNKEAYYNIAVSYHKLGEYEKAEENYNKMLENFPNNITTITSLGMCKLAQKNFKEGYDLFFKREKTSMESTLKNPWQKGQKFEDEILVIPEQGLGDQIQFIRYLSVLQKKVKQIYFYTPKPLYTIFKKNFPNIEFIKKEDINPDMQYIRITDLAYALDLDFDNIPFAEGYLKVEKSKIESDKLKVGLCWEAGSAGIRTMINRTINIRNLEPIINLKNIQIYSFQVTDSLKGNERYPQMINLARDFKDFEDTAKAMSAMDIILTVDTSVAHLAGALGIKTFLMLPYATDWRWFNDTKNTPWYNSIEIFKQQDPISWEKPIEDIICKINEFCS